MLILLVAACFASGSPSPYPVYQFPPDPFSLETEGMETPSMETRLSPEVAPFYPLPPVDPMSQWPQAVYFDSSQALDQIQMVYDPKTFGSNWVLVPYITHILPDNSCQYHQPDPSHQVGHPDLADLQVTLDSHPNTSTLPTTGNEQTVLSLEFAIREFAFDKETTHQLQDRIESGEFSAYEVSLISNDLLADAMKNDHANFVVSCLIRIHPEIMLSKVGDELFSLFSKDTVLQNEKGLRFLVAFLRSENLEVEDEIFSKMASTGALEKYLLMKSHRAKRWYNVILRYANCNKWIDDISIFLLQHRTDMKFLLPRILACTRKHRLAETEHWIALNVSEEEIDLALNQMESSNETRMSIREQ